MAPKQSAAFVFTETSNETGWSENGIAWLVGLVSTVYPFLGYDCAAHLSEEMSNPARDVPLAMVGSVVLNGLLGLAYCIVLLFSLSDLETLLTTTTGFPFVQLFINVTKSQPGAIILTLIPTLIATAANAAGLISTSRTAWALARDSGFPFPKYFSKIDDHLLVPKRMILCISFLQMLLGFIYLGSVTAFNAILSMSIFGVYLSYLLPVGYMLFFGRKDKQLHPPGPFSMGRFGAAVNVVAILWLLLALVFSTFPGVRPVTPQNMNYCIVVMAGWFAFGIVYYVIWGSKTYFGPCIDLEGIALARERSNAR
ncbi:Choline transport protein [Elsinoe australis]|uniref:Choline transport protein n=1 Tax=Elsinoe australis TaxID=40998 RepID=A0A2P7Z681_9PEZI|nr:Choline transport protein [Elsinoe australis]